MSFKEFLQSELNEAQDPSKEAAIWVLNKQLQREVKYEFYYYLSKMDLENIKKECGSQPRGSLAGPDKGQSISQLIRVATGKNVYLDGDSVILGDKPVGHWKGKTVGDVLKMAHISL